MVSGGTSFGSTDAFVIKYDHSGNQLWVNQFGTSSDDTAEIAKIGSDGVYIFGSTDGSFPMEVNYGGYDVFIAKLDFNTGNVIKISQSGTSENEGVDQVEAAADGFYVLNQNGKSAISKYGFDGSLKWTNTDFPRVLFYTLKQISIGGDGLYVVGNRLDTGGFVVKLDLITGKTTSLQSIGDSYYESTAVNVGTDGYVYVVGRQALGHPVDNNMVIINYSPTLSSYQWLERVHASIPSVNYSQILPLSLANGANGMYVFGTTWGSLGKTAFNDKTVFVAKIPY